MQLAWVRRYTRSAPGHASGRVAAARSIMSGGDNPLGHLGLTGTASLAEELDSAQRAFHRTPRE